MPAVAETPPATNPVGNVPRVSGRKAQQWAATLLAAYPVERQPLRVYDELPETGMLDPLEMFHLLAALLIALLLVSILKLVDKP